MDYSKQKGKCSTAARCLIIFAKEPEIGRVKTRLEPFLNSQQCLKLYRAFLQDTMDIAREAEAEHKIVFFDSRKESPDYLKSIAGEFCLCGQKRRNLGERLHNACVLTAKKGCTSIVIMGSDSPTLPVQLIHTAFAQLKRKQVVLGPTVDGGFYLVGLRTPCRKLFQGVTWSSPMVLRQTIANAKRLHLSIAMLKQWYDIDNERSFQTLIKELQRKNADTAGHIRRVLRCMNLKSITP